MTLGRWILAAMFLGAIGLSVFVFGLTADDPYAKISTPEAGPLPWLLVPSLFGFIGLFVAAILLCFAMAIRTLFLRRQP